MRLPALSDHAVIRYMERIRHVEIDAEDNEEIEKGRAYLAHLMPLGQHSQSAPPWTGRLRGGDSYFLLGDDVCFVVANRCAVTCIVRGSLPPLTRERRNGHRRSRRYARSRSRGR